MPVRLIVSDSTRIPSLLEALEDGGCIADPAGPDTVEVVFPGSLSVEDAKQAAIELDFFLRTWEAEHGDVTVDIAVEP